MFFIKIIKHKFCKFEPYCNIITRIGQRSISSWSSKDVRSAFISFFADRNHLFIQSSPVISWNDPSIDFVNAGMNQFKSIFLENLSAPCKAAVNYQKCIRVGGKHNDLSDVGKDTYHHTFFEMLGSWSFNSYSKELACKLCWDLLTKIYMISPDHLYVTYFSGDENLNLPADIQVKEIWKEIGVRENKILPFGIKDNFWEMGVTGPCGPCTEIHYERQPSHNGSSKINSGSEDIIEIWNLVFIQYKRILSGDVIPLSTQFVDTGMGLERLTAILNNKVSNYDSDLFIPIFDTIHKLSSKPKYQGMFNVTKGEDLDTSYRILADHSRMITAALSDGLLPHDSENLRRVIRRSLLIGWEHFGMDSNSSDWLGKICECVALILASVYPEMIQNNNIVKNLLEYEADLFIRSKDHVFKEWKEMVKNYPELLSITNRSPQLIESLKFILPKISESRNTVANNFPVSEALYICNNFGLTPNSLQEVLEAFNFNINFVELYEKLKNVNLKVNSDEQTKCESSSRMNVKVINKHVIKNIGATNDRFKYIYESRNNGTYEYNPMESTIDAIVSTSGDLVDHIADGQEAAIFCPFTNFYSIAGAQDSDKGILSSSVDNKFKVDRVFNIDDRSLHIGKVTSGSFSVGEKVVLNFNKGLRLANSKHHTAHHLLLASLKYVREMAYQRESIVTAENFVVDVFSHPSLKLQDIVYAENIVKFWIKEGISIKRETKPIFEALQEDKPSLLSGVTYPESVHVISTSLKLPLGLRKKSGDRVSLDSITSSELCCGTHVHNTSHLNDFAVIDIKQRGNGIVRITALCGKEATKLNGNVPYCLSELENWDNKITEAIRCNSKVRNLSADFKRWKNSIKKSSLPATFYMQVLEKYDHLSHLMDTLLLKESNWNELLHEFRDAIEKTPADEPILHLMKTEYRGSLAELQKVIDNVTDRPAAFVCSGWGRLRGCVFIPSVFISGGKCDTFISLLQEKVENISAKKSTKPEGEIVVFILNGIKKEDKENMQLKILKLCSQFITGLT